MTSVQTAQDKLGGARRALGIALAAHRAEVSKRTGGYPELTAPRVALAEMWLNRRQKELADAKAQEKVNQQRLAAEEAVACGYTIAGRINVERINVEFKEMVGLDKGKQRSETARQAAATAARKALGMA